MTGSAQGAQRNDAGVLGQNDAGVLGKNRGDVTGLRKGRGDLACEGRIGEAAGVARRRQGGIPARARRL